MAYQSLSSFSCSSGSTAQVEKMKAFYRKYTAVEEHFERMRDIVMKRRPNRIQYVQPNTFIEHEQGVLRQYPASEEGLIQS
jgi:dipeptidyl-peptidase III